MATSLASSTGARARASAGRRARTAVRGCAQVLGPALLAILGACASSPSRPGTKAAVGPGSDPDPSADRAPTVNTLYSMAKIMTSRSRDAEAEAILAKLIADHPEFMIAYSDLAELYLRHDRADSAAAVLEAGVKVAPRDAVMRNDLGMCQLMLGRHAEALESFTAAAVGAPRDARTRGNMAVALGMLGRLDESLALYLQLVPPADAHYNLGVLCEARKDSERAAQEFKLAEAIRSGKGPSAKPSTKAGTKK